jgi:hypothetical protein
MQGKELFFGMRVLPCQETPGIEIYGHAPQINSKNFSHVFNHKELYDVPGKNKTGSNSEQCANERGRLT